MPRTLPMIDRTENLTNSTIIQEKEAVKKAKGTVFQLLKIRQRSEKEIREKLKTKKFAKSVIEEVIAYLKRLELVDDRQFANKWISYRLRKPYGKHRIKFELKEKGIAETIIEDEYTNVLNQNNYSELETILSLTEKQRLRYKNIEPNKMKQRIYGYLCRRGFSQDKILQAIKRL